MMLSGFTGEILSELVDEPQAEVACVVINDFDGNVCRIEHNHKTDVFSLHVPTQKFGPWKTDETDICVVGEDAAEPLIWSFAAWSRELFL